MKGFEAMKMEGARPCHRWPPALRGTAALRAQLRPRQGGQESRGGTRCIGLPCVFIILFARAINLSSSSGQSWVVLLILGLRPRLHPHCSLLSLVSRSSYGHCSSSWLWSLCAVTPAAALGRQAWAARSKAHLSLGTEGHAQGRTCFPRRNRMADGSGSWSLETCSFRSISDP